MKYKNWSTEDFRAYLFIYCSFADHLEVPAERNYAIEKVGKEKFNEMHKEIENNTDEISINLIRKYVKDNHLSENFTNQLLKEVEGVFLSDGEFHKLERRLMVSLKHILKQNKN